MVDCIAFSHRFRIVLVSFSAVCTVKTRGNLLFVCQNNLNNLWLLLNRVQKFALSLETIRLRDNDIIITISFSNIVFSENDRRFRVDAG